MHVLSGEGGAAKAHKSSFHAIRNIISQEGFFGLYNGLSAGLLRQATYTTTRLGIYTTLFDMVSGPEGAPPPFYLKALIGMSAGAVGAFIGTPADLSLIRMTSDGSSCGTQSSLREVEQLTDSLIQNRQKITPRPERGYTSVVNALARIVQEEGFFALWRGCGPTIARAMVVNAAQLASYSQAKQFLLGTGYFGDNIGCHFGASMISGLVTTIASMPVDIAKTRIQNMKIIDGVPEYKGSL
ncbi:hypothetical protein BSL78_22805, partial [Apostichopus japonicus]